MSNNYKEFLIIATNRAIKKKNMQYKKFHDIPKPINNICPISLMLFNPDDNIIVLKCNHIFHTKYIELWVSKHMNCPMCRYPFN